jgi:hypothetical protein
MKKYNIKTLRQNGYKVRVLHTRHCNPIKKISGIVHEISNNGGSTTIEITTPDQSQTVIGKSVCSLKDNFNRRVGNEIALGRALEQLKIGF